MSKPNAKKYNLLQVQNHEAERRGGSTIKFDIGGQDFEIPAPGFFPDELKRAAGDDDKFLSLALGDDLKRFQESGGTSDMIGLLFQAYARDQGTSLGE
jgi:hypothetical protein